MIDAQIDAILVKIAAAGLTPRKHLGARLALLPAQVGTTHRRLAGRLPWRHVHRAYSIVATVLETLTKLAERDWWQEVYVSLLDASQVCITLPACPPSTSHC